MPSDLIYNTLKGENRLSDNVNSVSLHKVTAGVGEIYGSHIISQEILLWRRALDSKRRAQAQARGDTSKNAQAIGRAINLHNIPATSLKVRISGKLCFVAGEPRYCYSAHRACTGCCRYNKKRPRCLGRNKTLQKRRALDSNQRIPYDIGSLANCWFKPLTQPSLNHLFL